MSDISEAHGASWFNFRSLAGRSRSQTPDHPPKTSRQQKFWGRRKPEAEIQQSSSEGNLFNTQASPRFSKDRSEADLSQAQSSAGNSLNIQASPDAVPEAKTALETSKLALSALASVTCLIPYGTAVSVAIKGLLAVVDTVEKKYENEETFKHLNDRINRLIYIFHLLLEHTEELPQILELKNALCELSAAIEAMANQGWVVQFINSKDNASSLDKAWKKLDGIINDAVLFLTVGIRNQQKLDAQRMAFLRLKPPLDATYNSDTRTQSGGRTCLGATRGHVLKRIYEWVESDAGRLFWLHGPAGSGKSTISHTIADHYDSLSKEDFLAASFFFSRGYLSNSDILFQTIAFQLGDQHPLLKQAIANAITDDSTLLYKKANQLRSLILDPISKMVAFLPRRIVVVIDALDECDPDTAASHVIRLLATSLSSYSVPLPLRFLVTCRPEKHLYYLFMQPSAHHFDLSDVDATQDISSYLTDELEKDLSRIDIDFLVQFSEGLFIAASTLVKFLRLSPARRLQQVRSYGLSGLDSLYKLIVEKATEELISPEQESFRMIVGTIILASARLPMQALLDLLPEHRENKDLVFDGLRSVIHVPDAPNGVVHAFHSSFCDFLVNPKNDKTHWFIDTKKYHGDLARYCLGRMEMDLSKMDVCELQKHTKKNRDADVREKVKLLPGGLVYASRFWAVHFAKSKQGESSLYELLNAFALERLLCWMEVLCLLDLLFEGVDALRTTIQSLTQTRSYRNVLPPELIPLLSDAVHFMTDFHAFLAISAMHIYVTALPLSPRNSTLYQHYGDGHGFATTYHKRERKNHGGQLAD